VRLEIEISAARHLPNCHLRFSRAAQQRARKAAKQSFSVPAPAIRLSGIQNYYKGSLMANSISKKRKAAFISQGGRCWYCCAPMWEGTCKDFCLTFSVTRGAAKHLQCTAEHLHARCEGGSNATANIVAACWHCNSRRHRSKHPKTAPDFKRVVSERTQAGRWHVREILGVIQSVSRMESGL